MGKNLDFLILTFSLSMTRDLGYPDPLLSHLTASDHLHAYY